MYLNCLEFCFLQIEIVMLIREKRLLTVSPFYFYLTIWQSWSWQSNFCCYLCITLNSNDFPNAKIYFYTVFDFRIFGCLILFSLFLSLSSFLFLFGFGFCFFEIRIHSFIFQCHKFSLWARNFVTKRGQFAAESKRKQLTAGICVCMYEQYCVSVCCMRVYAFVTQTREPEPQRNWERARTRRINDETQY